MQCGGEFQGVEVARLIMVQFEEGCQERFGAGFKFFGDCYFEIFWCCCCCVGHGVGMEEE